MTRYKQRYGGYGNYDRYVELWPESITDIERVERAYWATRKRAERTYDRFEATMRAIHDAGGVAYAKCHGNCEQPCFYRYIAGVRPNGFVAAYLDDHAKQTADGMRSFLGPMFPEREPIYMDLGEAHWDAEEAVKTANGRWLSWRSALSMLLVNRMQELSPSTDQRTAHVVLNGRDYWLASQRSALGWSWSMLLTPEAPRVDVTATQLDAAEHLPRL